jgi:hypothetical protein
MINTDGTTERRAVMAAKGRDGPIWRFDLARGPVHAVGVDAATATRVAQLDPPGRDGVPVGPRRLGDERIIDASTSFGFRHVDLGSAGTPADGRLDGDRRGRATLPSQTCRVAANRLWLARDGGPTRRFGVLELDASSAAPDPPPADARVSTRATSTA